MATIGALLAGPSLAQDQVAPGLPVADTSNVAEGPLAYDRPINPDIFVIRPGEQFRITFLRSTIPSLSLRVTADGKLVHPSLGSINTARMTLTQLRQALYTALAKQFNAKDIEISVGSPRPVTIAVTGAVEKPGYYHAYSSNYVSDVIAMAGGVRTDGSTRRIVLNGGPKSIPVDLDRAMYLGVDSANPALYGGYRVEVPMKSTDLIQVVGEVMTPREIELQPGDDLTDVLAMAGGPTRSADLGKINVLGQPERILADGVHAGDIIDVPSVSESGPARVSVFGEVKSPGTYTFSTGSTIESLIKQAGGLTLDANDARIVVFRRAESDGTTAVRNGRYAVTAANSKLLQTAALWPSDSVVVPRKVGWVRVSGLVKTPGLLPFVEAENAMFYIRAAGGFLPGADQKAITLLNRMSKVSVSYPVATAVGDGDEIIVEPLEIPQP